MKYTISILAISLGVLLLPNYRFGQFIAPQDPKENKKSNADALFEIKSDKKTEPIETTEKKKEIENDQAAGESIRNIQAEILDKYNFDVKIRWLPSNEEGDFIVARSNYPIANMETLVKSDAIAVKPSGVNFHVDKNLPPGNYYYCVASRRKISNNQVVFEANQNFTTAAVVVTANEIKKSVVDTDKTEKKEEVKPDLDKKNTTDKNQQDKNFLTEKTEKTAVVEEKKPATELLVRLIYSQLINEDPATVRISWKGNMKSSRGYIVYRNSETISNLELLQKSDKIAEINTGAEYYVDRNLPAAGLYYYAVTSRDTAGNEIMVLEADQSYTRNAIVLKEAFHQENIETKETAKTKKNDSNLHQEKSIDLEEDKKTEPVIENKLRNQGHKENKNDSEVNKILDDWTDSIIRNSYMKGMYSETIQQLKNVTLQDRNLAARTKALFYTGLSFYHLDNHRKAIEYFSRPEVKKGYGERADFWHKKSLEQLR